ncbi:MAG: C1 family peptidase [Candidatus Geothermincolia bacterium]
MRKSIRIMLAVCIALAVVLTLAIPSIAAPPAAPPPAGGSPGLGLVPSQADPSRKIDSQRYGLSSGAPLAASRDLSASIPPIKNQGAYQSCVGWATGYYARSWYEKQEHPSWDLNDEQYQMSPQYVWNGINGGGDNPTSIDSALSYMETTGCTDWEQFPYDGASYAVQPDTTTRAAAGQYRIPDDWGWFFLQGSKGPDVVTQLKNWINTGNPLVMGIPIYTDFPDYGGNPQTAYYEHPGPDSSVGGHAVFIAGYNDNAGGSGRGGFLMIIWWGPTWNGNGRVWLSYEFVQNHVWEAWYMTDMDSTPTLSGLTPSNGGPGQLVTVRGDNLGGFRRDARVGFQGGKTGLVVTWANDEIQVRVPSGAQTGSMYVYDWESERTNGRAFTVGPPSNAGANWLLAEGATWPGFDEWVLLQNPNAESSNVKITFLTPAGEVAGPNVSVPGKSRVSVHVNEYVPNADVSTAVTVTSGATVCAERAMYFSGTNGKWGSHDSIVAQAVAETWYLAEGATWPGYDEWVLVMNPFNDPVGTRLTFQTPAGEVAGPNLNLAPNTRQSVHVNQYVPNQDVSTKVECTTAGYGVVAERSMYISAPDGKVDCHNSLGASQAAAAWGLTEGATWPGYEEWVLIQNPTATTAVADVFFLTPTEVIEGPALEVLPGRRVSVRVNDWVPNSDVSTMVFTDAEGQAVVVERAQYISSPDGKRGSHNSLGSIYSSKDWLLPEGCTYAGFDEWVLVMNPDSQRTAEVSLTFMTQQGEVQGPTASLPPASRVSFHVNGYVTGEVSTRVTSPEYVIAERAMYMNTPQGKQGATCSLGVPAAMLGGSYGSSGGSPGKALRRLIPR